MMRPFVLAFVLLSASCAGQLSGLRSDNGLLNSSDNLNGLLSFNPPTEVEVKEPIWSSSEGPIMVEIEDFDEPTVKALQKALPQIKSAGHQDLTIRIDSYGGSVHWGMEMVQTLETSGLNIRCVVDTKAMSMGFFLLESSACKERLMTTRSTLMVHEPWTQARGNSTQLEETAQRLRILCDSMVNMAAERMSISKDEILDRIDNREWHMDFEEALNVAAIDGTIHPNDLPKQYKLEIKELSLLDLLGG